MFADANMLTITTTTPVDTNAFRINKLVISSLGSVA